MKKFLRFAGILILIVAVALFILSLVEPTNIPVTRSIVIKAPKEVVFQQITNFKNWPKWSPWHRYDSTMKINYYGTDGQQGSGYFWDGNDKVGSGEMKDTTLAGNQMNYVFRMSRPFKNSATGYFRLEDTAGMTKVTWELTAHMPYPFNAVDIFMNMDKLMGSDFESGLANLKQVVDNQTAVLLPVAAPAIAADSTVTDTAAKAKK